MQHQSLPKNTFEIPRHLNDVRIDAALLALLQDINPLNKPLSRNFISERLRAKKVTVNGNIVKPSAVVSSHDLVVLTPDFFEANINTQESMEATVTILYEDDNILVINKPENLKMHQSILGERGATLSQWILEQYPDLQNVGEDLLRPGIVHRLDRETSGVLVIAKNNKSFEELKKIFQEREIEKTYVALVYGHLPLLEGKIDFSLTRPSGALKRRAIDATKDTGSVSGNVRTALTHYRVLSRYEQFDLVRLQPKTGRTHQIRVHLSALGHPIVGDKLYAFKPARRGEILFTTRHLLHARTLSFTLFKKKYDFLAPLAEDFQSVLRDIDGSKQVGYDDEALKSLLSE